MIDKYQEDISYPYYIRAKSDGINITDATINKLIELGGSNLTMKCLSCHGVSGPYRMYCNGCRELLINHLDSSRSICN